MPDDRTRDGIFLERDVKDNILIALQNRRGRPFVNPDPEAYERIPYRDQMMERLSFARDYLKGIAAKL